MVNPGMKKPNPGMTKANPGLAIPTSVPSPQPLGLSTALNKGSGAVPVSLGRAVTAPGVALSRPGTAGTASKGRAALAAAAAGRFKARLLF